MAEKQYHDLSQEEPDMVTTLQAQEYLSHPYPVWLLDSRGRVIGANLLVSWLWEIHEFSQLFDFTSVFTLFTQVRQRIPKDLNQEFFRKKIPVLKRLIGGHGESPYRLFIDYLLSDPELKKIYEEEEYIPDTRWVSKRIWEYMLNIAPPKGIANPEFLRFEVTIYRLEDGQFLGVYKPDTNSEETQAVVTRKFEQASSIADMLEYVQYEKVETYQNSGMKGGDLIIKESEPIPNTQPETLPYEEKDMVFEDEEEYVRFTDYVYDQFKGKGLLFSPVPIMTAVRLTPELLEKTRGLFAMREVTEEDAVKALESIQHWAEGRRPFDPDNLDDFYIPGETQETAGKKRE